MNKFKELIEFVINEEHEKAESLLHTIVAEKKESIFAKYLKEEEVELKRVDAPITDEESDVNTDSTYNNYSGNIPSTNGFTKEKPTNQDSSSNTAEDDPFNGPDPTENSSNPYAEVNKDVTVSPATEDGTGLSDSSGSATDSDSPVASPKAKAYDSSSTSSPDSTTDTDDSSDDSNDSEPKKDPRLWQKKGEDE
jgi:hypothetical protein